MQGDLQLLMDENQWNEFDIIYLTTSLCGQGSHAYTHRMSHRRRTMLMLPQKAEPIMMGDINVSACMSLQKLTSHFAGMAAGLFQMVPKGPSLEDYQGKTV